MMTLQTSVSSSFKSALTNRGKKLEKSTKIEYFENKELYKRKAFFISFKVHSFDLRHNYGRQNF